MYGRDLRDGQVMEVGDLEWEDVVTMKRREGRKTLGTRKLTEGAPGWLVPGYGCGCSDL